MDTHQYEKREFETGDGVLLRGRWYEPKGALDRSEYIAIIHPATAVPQGYYDSFATWLVGRGLPTFTYDYRGIGESRTGRSLRGYSASITKWIHYDVTAAVREARQRYPDKKLLYFCHSVGGHAMLLNPAVHEAEAIVMVGVGNGHHRFVTPGYRQLKRFLIFHAIMPLIVRVLGYVPGWAGTGEDLPAGVALGWARRCRQHAYFDPAELEQIRENLKVLQGKVLTIALSDDDYISPGAVADFGAHFPEENVEVRVYEPKTLNQRRIGHFAGFRPRTGGLLWDEMWRWLPVHSGAPELPEASL